VLADVVALVAVVSSAAAGPTVGVAVSASAVIPMMLSSVRGPLLVFNVSPSHFIVRELNVSHASEYGLTFTATAIPHLGQYEDIA
jgi:hypothetical protein